MSKDNSNDVKSPNGEENIIKVKAAITSSPEGKSKRKVGPNRDKAKDIGEDHDKGKIEEEEQDEENRDDTSEDDTDKREEDSDNEYEEDKSDEYEEDKSDEEDKTDNEDEDNNEEDKPDGESTSNEDNNNKGKKDKGIKDDKKNLDAENPRKRVKQPNRRDRQADKSKTSDEGKSVGKEAKDVANKAKGEEVNKVEEHLDNAAKAVALVQNAATIAFKVLTSPITWVVVAITIVLVWVMAFSVVIGKNDYNEACGFSGSGAIGIPFDADDYTRKSAITSWLTSTPFVHMGDKPMTKEMAFGIMGNFIQESSNSNNVTVQNENLEYYKTCDNACVLAIDKDESKGFGLAQWDRGRRIGLINHADSTGKPWYDLQTQLDFLKTELDGSHGKSLSNAGFFETTKTIKDYTELWEQIFEVSADDATMIARRVAYSEQWASEYTGGGGTVGSCTGGSIDASNLVQLAIQVSYSRAEKATGLGYGDCTVHNGCGMSFSKSEYIEAKNLAEAQTSADPLPGLMASCDRFVSTMMRLTGTDTGYPWGAVTQQVEYMSRPDSGWEQVSCPNRQPGDVIQRSDHIMLYIGEHEGKDSIASASSAFNLPPGARGRGAMIGENSCSGNAFSADGGLNQGWRKVSK